MALTRRRVLRLAALGLAAPAVARARGAGVTVAPVVRGLAEPWALAFLPGGRFLVTERGGRLTLFGGAAPVPVAGLPEVSAEGQGGLLDVMVPRDFAATRRLWLTYAHPADGGASTALAHARLSDDGAMLQRLTRVHDGPAVAGGLHFGSRAVQAPDGSVFLTTGDRGDGPLAQDVTRPEGKVLRFAADGAPRTAAEFAGQDVVPGLWSLGHRNIQGAALDGQGRLWTVEHGARGGDELNRPQPGRNHGWPVITYGVNYNGRKIGEGTAKDGMEQPVHWWDPSIAPSGLAILRGDAMGWRGQFLTGSLNGDFISRLDPAAGWAEHRIATPETSRVRDVREAPDGSVWFLSVGEGAVFRMVV